MKKIVITLIAFTLVLSTTACNMFASATQKYVNAFMNTSKVDSMQTQTKMAIKLDLSKASEGVKKDFEGFKEVTMNTDQWIDNKNNKSETRSFTRAGDIMLDSKIYAENDKAYMKSSLFGDKFIELSSGEKESQTNDSKEFEKLSSDMTEIWKNAIQNEILSSEGNSIENTPDGDIKVSINTLQLTDEKMKNIMKKIAELISGNDKIISYVADNAEKYNKDAASKGEAKKLIQEWMKKLPQVLEENKDKYAVENLKLTARIDKDSYIIDETFEGTLVLKGEGETRINFSSNTTRWNINSGNVVVNIPQIKQEDIIKIDELEKDLKSDKYSEDFKKMFEGFGKKK